MVLFNIFSSIKPSYFFHNSNVENCFVIIIKDTYVLMQKTNYTFIIIESGSVFIMKGITSLLHKTNDTFKINW